MSADNSSAPKGGVGFFGLLTIVFITLKLCKVIDWSWWWILSPSIFSIGLFVTVIVVLVAVFIIKEIAK